MQYVTADWFSTVHAYIKINARSLTNQIPYEEAFAI